MSVYCENVIWQWLKLLLKPEFSPTVLVLHYHSCTARSFTFTGTQFAVWLLSLSGTWLVGRLTAKLYFDWFVYMSSRYLATIISSPECLTSAGTKRFCYEAKIEKLIVGGSSCEVMWQSCDSHVTVCEVMWQSVTVMWGHVTVCEVIWQSVRSYDSLWGHVTVCEPCDSHVTVCEVSWQLLEIKLGILAWVTSALPLSNNCRATTSLYLDCTGCSAWS